jgi:hypothetical protein
MEIVLLFFLVVIAAVLIKFCWFIIAIILKVFFWALGVVLAAYIIFNVAIGFLESLATV